MSAAQQASMGFDDPSFLDVVQAKWSGCQPFSWSLFEGYNRISILTYSVSMPAIVRLLEEFDFEHIDCVFGSEVLLCGARTIVAYQQHSAEATIQAIKGLRDDRRKTIIAGIEEGRIKFRVFQGRHVAHAKLFMLERTGDAGDARRRVLVGSANLSLTALSGDQPETLVSFSDDAQAWAHYADMFKKITESAVEHISLPNGQRFDEVEVKPLDMPALEPNSGDDTVLFIESERARETAFEYGVGEIMKLRNSLPSALDSIAKPDKQGRITITPDLRQSISQVAFVRSDEQTQFPWLSFTGSEHIDVSGTTVALAASDEQVAQDAQLLLRYFDNFAEFVGDVGKLQHDYFLFMAWLFFSPFLCEVRTQAALLKKDVIRYPLWAVLHGRSNCGKSMLVDTLVTAMLGHSYVIHKSNFTRTRLKGLQEHVKRFPVVFDDVDRTRFQNHGVDVIKQELPPQAREYPGFVLSMNEEPTAFTSEVVKRAFLIYTTTAAPSHLPTWESIRQGLDAGLGQIRRELQTHLYHRYLTEMQARLQALDGPPDDWLILSTEVLCDLLTYGCEELPAWCKPVTWEEFANHRYDHVRIRLRDKLRSADYSVEEGVGDSGWTFRDDKILVWEPITPFGKPFFEWDDLPSTLIDPDMGGKGRKVLLRREVEQFLGHPVDAPVTELDAPDAPATTKRPRRSRRWWFPFR